MTAHSYHLRRASAETAMSDKAASSVANIAHAKLADLHRSAAAAAAIVAVRAAEAGAALLQLVAR